VTNGDMRGVGGVQTSLMLLDGDNVYARCEEGARAAARTRSAMTISRERASLCHQHQSKPRN